MCTSAQIVEPRCDGFAENPGDRLEVPAVGPARVPLGSGQKDRDHRSTLNPYQLAASSARVRHWHFSDLARCLTLVRALQSGHASDGRTKSSEGHRSIQPSSSGSKALDFLKSLLGNPRELRGPDGTLITARIAGSDYTAETQSDCHYENHMTKKAPAREAQMPRSGFIQKSRHQMPVAHRMAAAIMHSIVMAKIAPPKSQRPRVVMCVKPLRRLGLLVLRGPAPEKSLATGGDTQAVIGAAGDNAHASGQSSSSER